LKRPQGGRAKKFGRTGRPSIMKTERPRSANLLQMPRGLMCKLRQRGREYGSPAGSRGIDPPLQPFSPSQQLLGPSFMDGRRPGRAFRLNPNSGPVCPTCDIGCCAVRWPVLIPRGLFGMVLFENPSGPFRDQTGLRGQYPSGSTGLFRPLMA
jgi:hypothetical protein